mgnify:CR=1 FL=1|jgi:hypothetical protein
MNKHIKNRIDLINLAKQEECKAGDLDEKYSGALWDWAGEIANMPMTDDLEELQAQIYYALQETFETLHKGA